MNFSVGSTVYSTEFYIQLDHNVTSLVADEMLDNGDRREVEIRGCTLWAIEVINDGILIELEIL